VVAARSSVGRTTYFFTQLRAWVHYIGQFLWPARLVADNGDFGWSTGPGDPRVQVAMLLLIALAATVIWGMRRHPLYAFGILWTIVTLLPTSSFFPLAEPVNEHRPYLPVVGLTLAVVSLVFDLASRPGRIGERGRQGLVCAGLAVAGTLLVLATAERNRVWDSPRSLWTDVVAKSPMNGRAHMNLGLAMMEEGDIGGAARQYDLAIERAPGYALAFVNRGILRQSRGDREGAIADIEHALRLTPDNIFTLYRAARIYADAGNLARAAQHLERAKGVSPRHGETLRLLLEVDLRSGRLDRVAGDLADLESLALASDEDRHAVAFHLLKGGRSADAVPILEAVLRRQPEDIRARFNLGYAYLGLGRQADAIREMEGVLSREPKHRQAWQNLLWIHRSTGDRAAYARATARMDSALKSDAAEPPQGPPARSAFRGSLPAVLEVPAAREATERADSPRADSSGPEHPDSH
jgi:tetratricopeptide (TPR) repeat protein